MKIKKTYQLTLAILAAILGAGVGSAVLAYKMGYEALKGINQPDVNPTKKFSTSEQITARPQPFKPINEKDILKKVDVYIQKQKANPKPQKEPAKEVKKEAIQTQQKTEGTPAKSDKVSVKFPIIVKDRGVTLEITQVAYQGGSLLLNVNLKNEGEEAFQFLYSFLEVQDDRGQILSAITEGLPSEIPANSETFQGTVEIPMTLIEKSNLITLKLTDYPNQKLKLNLTDIPVQNIQEGAISQ